MRRLLATSVRMPRHTTGLWSRAFASLGPPKRRLHVKPCQKAEDEEGALSMRQLFFKHHGLAMFNEAEILRAHQRFLKEEPDAPEADRAVCVLQRPREELVEYDTFKKAVIQSAEKIDQRIFVLSSSFFATGLSIGVIIPMLPVLSKTLELTPAEFSWVVSAFALSKLISGIPSGSYSERHGRKRMIVYGTITCALGIGLVGTTLSPALAGVALYWLLGARLLTGAGHSFFSAGGLNYVSDVSNAMNRARSLAPISMAIHGGMMMGPVIGGFLVEAYGIQFTYYGVSLAVLGIAALNRLILRETFVPSPNSSPRKNPFSEAFRSWKKLVRDYAPLRDTLFLNWAYWITLAGGQFTLLPLLMLDLDLGASQIGLSFAAMSVVTVLSGQPLAYFADKYGKQTMLGLASVMLTAGMVSLSYASSFSTLLLALVPMAMGSTSLSSLPLAYLSDIVKPHERPQAISLLRFVGDVGFLCGAGLAGIMSQATSIGFTLQSNTIFIGAGISFFMLRRFRERT